MPEHSPAPLKITTAAALLEEGGADLWSIFPRRLSIEMLGEEYDGLNSESTEIKAITTTTSVDTLVRVDMQKFGFLFQVNTKNDFWEAHLDFAVNYTTKIPVEITREALEEFVNRCAIMAVWPYLREALQSLTCRLPYPPFTLDLLHSGESDIRLTEYA